MRHLLLVLPLTLVTPFAFQKSAKPDFKVSVERAQKAFEAKSYGTATKELRQALAAVTTFRLDAIANALPPAPEGMTFKDTKRELGGALYVGSGSDLERRYSEQGGARSIMLKVQADSAIVATLLPMLTNPMLLQGDRGAELLEYGKNKAVLRPGKDGKSIRLQIVIDSAHLLEVDSKGFERDALLKVFDDVAVERVAKELVN